MSELGIRNAAFKDDLLRQSHDFVARRDWEPLPFSPIQLPPKSKILILKLSAIGDCLVASPIAAALRQRYPDAHIAWAVQSKAKTVVEGNPALDEVIVWNGGTRGLLTAMREVRKRKFDAVIDIQGALKSAPLLWASGAKYRLVSARAESIARRAANYIVPMSSPPPHAGEQYLRVASALDVSPPAQRRLKMPLAEAERSWAANFWKENDASERVVALNPASARPIKAWPAANYGILADLLAQSGIQTLFLGGPGDIETVNGIIASMKCQPLNAAGKTNLRQLGALLEKCALLVSADTGPMHIAAGVGTPIVALFGPTDPRRTGPVGDNHLVLTRDLPCRPCFQKPTCERFECLTDMQPEDVLEAVLEALATAPNSLGA